MTVEDGPRVAVIVLAAGNGSRLGRNEPKAFVHLAGRPTLVRALDAVYGMDSRPQVIVTVPASYVPMAKQLVRSLPGSAGHHTTVIVGGASRQRSVAVALNHLLPTVQVVLVHDAARPLAPTVLFESVTAEVFESGRGVVPGLRVADTIKRTTDSGRIVETVDRSVLSAVQTPQGFPREHLVAAHRRATHEHTDDSALVAAAGFPVHVIAGDFLAFKITTGWELRNAEKLLSTSATATLRVGTGTDAHAFDESKPLWLCGLFWPEEVGLRGHSDGDVVCHAICDAMLSAARLGDLGSVFGDDDPTLAGAHGDVFLERTVALLAEVGLEVGNVAVQIVGNHPVLAPRRREAEALLSRILNATVSIAATTTDALGFTGRGEGVAAIATALVHPAMREASVRTERTIGVTPPASPGPN